MLRSSTSSYGFLRLRRSASRERSPVRMYIPPARTTTATIRMRTNQYVWGSLWLKLPRRRCGPHAAEREVRGVHSSRGGVRRLELRPGRDGGVWSRLLVPLSMLGPPESSLRTGRLSLSITLRRPAARGRGR
jgi:hypothetical protein